MSHWTAILHTYDGAKSYRLLRDGQLVASVSRNERGWIVIPRTADRKRSRKRHETAAEAVASMFGAEAKQAIEKFYAGYAFKEQP